MVLPGDVTAIPSDVGKEDVTLVTTSFGASLPSDVAMENVSSSDALQQGLGIETSTSVAVETALSSDVPTVPLDDVTKVVDSVTREATDSKLKLHRQHAVTEEDAELPAPALVVSSQPSENVDSITTSLNGLSIGMHYVAYVWVNAFDFDTHTTYT